MSKERIAELNDLARKDPAKAGARFVMTSGINAMTLDVQMDAVQAVQRFDAFTEDNDPHGERDFGSFDVDGVKCFWKIDYYAPDMEHGSEDPGDPAVTTRVVTVMRADEY